jgi:hypothetical protein
LLQPGQLTKVHTSPRVARDNRVLAERVHDPSGSFTADDFLFTLDEIRAAMRANSTQANRVGQIVLAS